MSALLSIALVALPPTVTVNEALSGLFGCISLAAWMCLLVPQFILNYKNGNAEGVSMIFLTIWLIGDAANLAGAIWAGLVPTAIAVPIYFCFSDIVLVTQCLYYNHVNARRAQRQLSSASAQSEDEPLLSRQSTHDSFGLPRSRRRSAARRLSQASELRSDALSKILEEEEIGGTSVAQNVKTILLVCVAGTAGWLIAWQSGAWQPTPTEGSAVEPPPTAVGAQILGYFSTVCYLSARIPQIIKNYRHKSCEGLALLFFLLAITGNMTYAAGIIFHSQEKAYLLKTLPWTLGSLGTISEDITIFIQFQMYAYKPARNIAVE